MTWLPPFFTCGLCGGEIGRWPMINMLKQKILDWRHIEVPARMPDGSPVAPHRAVLGTPVPLAAVLAAKASPEPEPEGDDDVVVVPDACPPPEVPARPAEPYEIPPSAASIAKLAEENGWYVEVWYMRGTRMSARWKALGVVSDIVVRAARDGHRVVASWQTKVGLDHEVRWTARDWPGTPYVESFNPWKFDDAYSLTRTADPIGSPELRKILTTPRTLCDECNEPPALHHLTEGGYVCHPTWVAAQQKEII